MKMNEYIYNLISKYKTNDPFLIADYEGIIYTFGEGLSDEFKGINVNIDNKRVIILNANLKFSMEKHFYMAHELFHALHHHETVSLYHQVTNEKMKNEKEANEFATLLLLSDYCVEENQSSYDILKENYIPESMAKFIEEDY